MSLYKLISFALFVSVSILQVSLVECRPRTQRIVVHGHEWTVPNEPGWSDGKNQRSAVDQF